jgi:membrane-bound lytic murein transglycosylase MltF
MVATVACARIAREDAVTRRLSVALASLLAAALLLPAAAARAQLLERIGLQTSIEERFTGDFDAMVERRLVRVLVVPSRTFYFVDRGTQRGASYDLGRAFEEEINRTLGKRILRVEVVFVPVARDDLLKALLEGRGDIAAANLTATPEREALVDFGEPLFTGVDEIVVSGPATPELRSLDDLSDREVFVRPSSSYFQSLWRLNESFAARGLLPVRIKPAPEELEDEDILEMVRADLVPLTVVDSHKGDFWAQVFPNLRLHRDLALRRGASIGWAFRKNSPQLAERVNAFAKTHRKGTAFGNIKFREYLKSTKFVTTATAQADYRRFEQVVELFRRYGEQYQLDWLLVAAQGYQESRLDHSVRSPVGAIGVMQVMPATGKELGVGDVHELEPNVHAGVKYLHELMERYFADAAFDPLNRCLFAFAAYNAGPARVAKLRKEAAARGLDPNVWFHHVENVAAERVGQETVRYVGNIFKYYVAYRLAMARRDERERARVEAGFGPGADSP